jgi:hypothetical protein
MFERFYNDRVLPDPLTFRWKYRDADEAAERVAAAEKHVGVMNAFVDLMNKTGVTDVERLNEIVITYLARNIEGMEELLYEGDGAVIRLYTDDPEIEALPETGLEVADDTEVNTDQDIGTISEQITLTDDSKEYRLAGAKAFNTIADEFVQKLGGTLITASQGRLRGRRLGAYVREYLAEYGYEAFRQGKKDGGVDEERLTIDEDVDYRGWLGEQNKFIGDLERRIRRGTSTGEDKPRRPLTDAEIWATARAWGNVGLQKAYYLGVQSADANGMYEFTGDDGKESCSTCKRLKGQIHRMHEWKRASLIPGIDVKNFECGGFQCQHRLRKVKGRSRGRLKEYLPVLSLDQAFYDHFWPDVVGKGHEHAPVHNHS